MKQKLIFVIIVIVFIAGGILLLTRSRAATPYVVSETEQGKLSGSATMISDSAAAGGKAVLFGGRQAITVDSFPQDGSGWSAHRGGGQSPYMWFDGTMTAYRNAYAAGATMIDLDTQMTKDGVLVAMHDATVDRTTAGSGAVDSFNYKDLPLVDMRYVSGDGWAPEKVPTIDQVLSELGGKVLLTIEAKESADVPDLIQLIKSKNLQDSMFINVRFSHLDDVKKINAAGLKAHVWGLESTADIRAADAAGAWLIELPYNSSSTVLAAAQSAKNIKRVVAAPIDKLNQRAEMTAGFDGFVSDSPLYLDRSPLDRATASTIAPQLSTHKIGPGWQTVASAGSQHNLPLFNTRGLVLKQGDSWRRLSLGNMNGTRPASGSMTFSFILGATATASNRTDFRVMVPREEGNGSDETSRGYVLGLRKNGSLVMWTAPKNFGAGVSLGSAATSVPGDDEEVILRFDWTATTVQLSRLDGSGRILGTIGPIANADWRGPDIMVTSTGPGILTGLTASKL